MMSSAASSSAAIESSPVAALAGSSGVGGVTRVPWLQFTSASRRAVLRAVAGQRHGASGARSRSHFRTVSPLRYVRLSKYLQSCRIGMGPVCQTIGPWKTRAVRRALLVVLVGLVAAACGGSDDDPTRHRLDNSLRLNEIQVRGTHNSYHLRPRPELLDALAGFDRGWRSRSSTTTAR